MQLSSPVGSCEEVLVYRSPPGTQASILLLVQHMQVVHTIVCRNEADSRSGTAGFVHTGGRNNRGPETSLLAPRPAAGHGTYHNAGVQLRAGMVANDRTGDGGPVWRPRRCILLPYIAGSYTPPANAGARRR